DHRGGRRVAPGHPLAPRRELEVAADGGAVGEAAPVGAGSRARPLHDAAARAAAAEVGAPGGARRRRGDRGDAPLRDRLPALGLRRAADRRRPAPRGVARARPERERTRPLPAAGAGSRCGLTDSVAVLAAAELPPGARATVEAFETTIALFNLDGALFALANACPHYG